MMIIWGKRDTFSTDNCVGIIVTEFQVSIEKVSSIKMFLKLPVSASTGGVASGNHHLHFQHG